uniref:Transposase n=1 Tax=Heterorhabditis bacteriophora TaxID=37862 RepID=A0A1I7WAJ8_HETBA
MRIVAETSIGRVWQDNAEFSNASPRLNGTDPRLAFPLRKSRNVMLNRNL